MKPLKSVLFAAALSTTGAARQKKSHFRHEKKHQDFLVETFEIRSFRSLSLY